MSMGLILVIKLCMLLNCPSLSLSVPFVFQDPVQDSTVGLVIPSASAPLGCARCSVLSLCFMTFTLLKSGGRPFVAGPLIWVCLMFSHD